MKKKQKKNYVIKSGNGSGEPSKVSEPMAVLENLDSLTESETEPSRLEVIEILREGYSFEQFESITQDLPIAYGDWPKILHMSKRTLDRHKDEDRFFDLPSSERIFELAELYRSGLEVFEDVAKLDRWLFRPNPMLNGLAPKDFFDTSVGIDLLKEQLLQIEYGILA